MYVCVCKAVTDCQIETAVRAGAHTLHDLRRELDIMNECGCCRPFARNFLQEARARLPAGISSLNER